MFKFFPGPTAKKSFSFGAVYSVQCTLYSVQSAALFGYEGNPHIDFKYIQIQYMYMVQFTCCLMKQTHWYIFTTGGHISV